MTSRFICEQCDYKATQKGYLLKHVKAIHEGVKFPCEQCDYKAIRKENLLIHIKSTHEGIKFPCEQFDYKAMWKVEGTFIETYKTMNNVITRQHRREIY